MTFISESRIYSPTLHSTIIISIFGFLSILVGSIALNVEIVSKGIGKAVPSKRIQEIQSDQSGIIRDIHVKNGDEVMEGDKLVSLDVSLHNTNLQKMLDAIERNRISKFRVAASLAAIEMNKGAGADLVKEARMLFEKDSSATHESFFDFQGALMISYLLELKTKLRHIALKAQTSSEAGGVIIAHISRIEALLDIQKQRLLSSETLLKKGIGSKASYLDDLEQHTSYYKQLQLHKQELQRSKAQTDEFHAERESILASFVRQLREERAELSGQSETLKQNLIATKTLIKNATLIAPVNGIVDKLNINTIGGVAQAGDILMSIVPSNDSSEIEAIFPNADSGFLKRGQRANIKLDAYPAERFGHIKGIVVDVSADSTEYEDGKWGFVVRVVPTTPYLKTPLADYQIRSGMTATVDAITGQRALITYFFAPVFKVIQESLGER